MGSNLSCVSKNAKTLRSPAKASSSPKSRKSANVNGDLVDDDAEYVVAEKAVAEQAIANGTPKPKAPKKTKEALVKSALSTEPIILLDGAPSNYHLPNKLGKLPSPSASELLAPPKDKSPQTGGYKSQPADCVARKIARDGPRPASWSDLHYHLIGRRDFTRDEDKVRALFTWLCSLNPTRAVFPNQAKKDSECKKPPALDSLERVLNGLVEGRSSYFQSFQTLCSHSGIECHVVRGIAKGVAYDLGQKLTLDDPKASIIDPKTQKLNPKLAHLEHAWNCCKIDGQWQLFDPAWAARRLAVGLPEEDVENKENSSSQSPEKNPINQASHAVLAQYQSDMFYFMTPPKRLLHTHYPDEEKWQLLQPPVTLKKFQDSALLKPSFFRYGLALYSHPDGFIPVKNELTLKFLLPEVDADKLLFTFNLTLEGLGQIYQGKNLSTYGIHTISLREKMVTFMFRFPKKGVYKLIIYSRTNNETLFADICEYKIQALFDIDFGKDSKSSDASTSEIAAPIVMPFPPSNQSSYGPTGKAEMLGLQTMPLNLDPIMKAKTGCVEVRFCQTDSEQKLPRLAARLKSIQQKTAELENCILYRQVEASRATTGLSSMWTSLSNQGPCIPTNVITAYLPKVGEYSLEVFAKPSDAGEDESYHLVWQFLIDAEESWLLSEQTQERLAMIEMGAREPIWSELGLKTCSHQDPLIRVPTVARIGAELPGRKRTEKDLLSEFAASHSSMGNSSLAVTSGGFPADDSNMGSQITVIDTSDMKSDRSDAMSPISMTHRTLSPVEEAMAEIKPRDCDFHLLIEAVDKTAIIMLAQMVDISTSVESEQDVTDYILKEPEDDDDHLHRAELMGEGISDSSPKDLHTTGDRLSYLIRIPKGGRFYKLFFYAGPKDMDPNDQIPLVYTYLIEAPNRLTSNEMPYIGSLAGPFPEKDHKSHKVSLRT